MSLTVPSFALCTIVTVRVLIPRKQHSSSMYQSKSLIRAVPHTYLVMYNYKYLDKNVCIIEYFIRLPITFEHRKLVNRFMRFYWQHSLFLSMLISLYDELLCYVTIEHKTRNYVSELFC